MVFGRGQSMSGSDFTRLICGSLFLECFNCCCCCCADCSCDFTLSNSAKTDRVNAVAQQSVKPAVNPVQFHGEEDLYSAMEQGRIQVIRSPLDQRMDAVSIIRNEAKS